MFANFLYFIIALLVLTLYEPVDEPPFSSARALLLFIGFNAIFAGYCRFRFRRLKKAASWLDQAEQDHRFGSIVTQLSIGALILFSLDIWALHLPSYLEPIQWLADIPTLRALIFLLIFVSYLTLVWYLAFDAYRHIYRSDISRTTYVYSNIAFSIPVLIPWILLFGIADIIRLLPFDLPKRILDTPMGQTGYFLIFLVIAAVFAPLLIQRFWRCRPLKDSPHRQRIEDLCRRAGIRYADIVYWPIFGGRMITAGVMGLVSRFRYIMVTDALLGLLSPVEIDQVIAHEIGHVKRNHLLLYLLFFIGFMIVSYATFPLSYYLVFFVSPVLTAVLALNLDPSKTANILNAFLLVMGVIVYFRYIFGYFMRNFERQADTYVFNLFPSAQPLIATFDKIVATSGQPADKPNWHHYSIQQRIDYLKRCEQSPIWIKRHDRKVSKGIAVYLIGFIITGLAVFQFNDTVFNRGLQLVDVSALESYLNQKQNKTAEDGLRYMTVGNAYFEKNQFNHAARMYEKALLLDPDNPDILNNLAWLLAVSEEKNLRDPQRALVLAQKAIALKKAPHIWDTLAAALFANGKINKAIAAEEEALAMSPKDRRIYEEQLEKYKQFLERSESPPADSAPFSH